MPTSADCIVALRKRFPPPQFAFFEQVANGTGSKARRWADAVAMGIWPSRGLELHGFEVKTNRPDWLRELKNPEKSVEVQSYCDRWHIVAPAGLVPPAELPPTWGLIEITKGGRTRIAVEAPRLDARALTRDFVAAVLRRHYESWGKMLSGEYARGREEGAENGHGELATRLKRSEDRFAKLLSNVETFEKDSGVKINYAWNLGDVSKAVEVLTRNNHFDLADDLERTAARYEHTVKRLREDVAALRKTESPKGTD